jgi:hypothetical protein
MPPLADSLPELAGRIRAAVAIFTLNLLNNGLKLNRYDIRWAAHGALIEDL